MSLVLVIDADCRTCVERVADLSELAVTREPGSGLGLVVLSAGPSPEADGLTPHVVLASDPKLVGSLSIGAFPTGLVFDRTGTEIARSVLFDRPSIERLFDWAVQQNDPQRVTTKSAEVTT